MLPFHVGKKDMAKKDQQHTHQMNLHGQEEDLEHWKIQSKEDTK